MFEVLGKFKTYDFETSSGFVEAEDFNPGTEIDAFDGVVFDGSVGRRPVTKLPANLPKLPPVLCDAQGFSGVGGTASPGSIDFIQLSNPPRGVGFWVMDWQTERPFKLTYISQRAVKTSTPNVARASKCHCCRIP